MEKDNLYTMTLCQEDWQRVIDALRNEAYALLKDSERAQRKGAGEYTLLLWGEYATFNALADGIDTQLP
jgi:hypothetical protein